MTTTAALAPTPKKPEPVTVAHPASTPLTSTNLTPAAGPAAVAPIDRVSPNGSTTLDHEVSALMNPGIAKGSSSGTKFRGQIGAPGISYKPAAGPGVDPHAPGAEGSTPTGGAHSKDEPKKASGPSPLSAELLPQTPPAKDAKAEVSAAKPDELLGEPAPKNTLEFMKKANSSKEVTPKKDEACVKAYEDKGEAVGKFLGKAMGKYAAKKLVGEEAEGFGKKAGEVMGGKTGKEIGHDKAMKACPVADPKFMPKVPMLPADPPPPPLTPNQAADAGVVIEKSEPAPAPPSPKPMSAAKPKVVDQGPNQTPMPAPLYFTPKDPAKAVCPVKP